MQILNTTGEEIGEKEVYEALGHPSPEDIRHIQYHLLNMTLEKAYSTISNLCKQQVDDTRKALAFCVALQGYALIDVQREVAENLWKEGAIPQEILVRMLVYM